MRVFLSFCLLAIVTMPVISQEKSVLVKSFRGVFANPYEKPTLDSDSFGVLDAEYVGFIGDRPHLPTSYTMAGELHLVDYLSMRDIALESDYTVRSVQVLRDAFSLRQNYGLTYSQVEGVVRWSDATGTTVLADLNDLPFAEKFYRNGQLSIPIIVAKDRSVYVGDGTELVRFDVLANGSLVERGFVIDPATEPTLSKLGFRKDKGVLFFEDRPATAVFDDSWDNYFKAAGISSFETEIPNRFGSYFVSSVNNVITFNLRNTGLVQFDLKKRSFRKLPFTLVSRGRFLGVDANGEALYYSIDRDVNRPKVLLYRLAE